MARLSSESSQFTIAALEALKAIAINSDIVDTQLSTEFSAKNRSNYGSTSKGDRSADLEEHDIDEYIVDLKRNFQRLKNPQDEDRNRIFQV
ncbi:hypothetical protein IQ235_12295 [Oscillatoriales cyanobacterium LEGE 11467]|uniref:Uncharacterized protein n=1 Tax=Zarconia navalis LEGE 11467 TaxID=1828826 RepID=A0A928Z8G1_9CYAN|nr:hypothetical protein [Zarconia navalis]MBE9041560.1 hypothetical protein [Zarconia navalis LEGE 11467]